MSETNRARSPSTRHMPGELGVWMFIIGDMTVFALFFATFTFYRAQDPVGFNDAQTLLNQNFGAINTLLLLASSWLVVMGVRAAKSGRSLIASRMFTGAGALGLSFIVVKYFEWGAKIGAGHTLTSHDFFMYYYIFTGIHMLHVVIGLGVLTYLILRTRRGDLQSGDILNIEGGANFWHMVDLLWIVLFPLLYLMR